jgi:ribosome-binding factor A
VALDRLCAAVLRALRVLLPGALGDPALQKLEVEAVTPAPDAGRLRILVRTPAPDPALSGRLEAVAPLLRSEVAQAVARRRAPRLVFEVRAREEMRS